MPGLHTRALLFSMGVAVLTGCNDARDGRPVADVVRDSTWDVADDATSDADVGDDTSDAGVGGDTADADGGMTGDADASDGDAPDGAGSTGCVAGWTAGLQSVFGVTAADGVVYVGDRAGPATQEWAVRRFDCTDGAELEAFEAPAPGWFMQVRGDWLYARDRRVLFRVPTAGGATEVLREGEPNGAHVFTDDGELAWGDRGAVWWVEQDGSIVRWTETGGAETLYTVGLANGLAVHDGEVFVSSVASGVVERFAADGSGPTGSLDMRTGDGDFWNPGRLHVDGASLLAISSWPARDARKRFLDGGPVESLGVDHDFAQAFLFRPGGYYVLFGGVVGPADGAVIWVDTASGSTTPVETGFVGPELAPISMGLEDGVLFYASYGAAGPELRAAATD